MLGTLSASKTIEPFCQFWITNNGTHNIILSNKQQEGYEFWFDGNLIGSNISSHSVAYQGLGTGFWILPLSSGPLDQFLLESPKFELMRKLNVHVSYRVHNEERKRAQFEKTKCHFCVIV